MFAKFGNAVASLCVEKRGAIPAMPTLEDVAGRI
jgi:fructokinase